MKDKITKMPDQRDEC